MFDAIVDAEARFEAEGREEGLRLGRAAGQREGMATGCSYGVGMGVEIGEISGAVAVWSAILREEPEKFSTREKRSVAALAEALSEFPVENPLECDNVQERLDRVRAKYTVAKALMRTAFSDKAPAMQKARDTLSF